jgi:acyl-CoA thioesterase
MGSHWDALEQTAGDEHTACFTATISDHWMLAIVPQGGYVAGLAARAMAATLGRPDQPLRSFTAVFAGRVACGPVEIDVTLLRRGRSMSQLTATVRNPGAAAGLTAVAVHGASRPGHAFTELTMPDVPGPDELRSFRDPLPDGVEFEFERPMFPFFGEIIDGKPAIGRPPWEPFVPVPAETAFWYRFDDPLVGPDGMLDPAGAMVLCDTMPNAVGQKLGPDVGPWFGPSADFTIHLLAPAPPGWLLAHNRARHAGDGYASVDMALWDPRDRRLVAYATQVMFFVPVPGS